MIFRLNKWLEKNNKLFIKVIIDKFFFFNYKKFNGGLIYILQILINHVRLKTKN